MQPRFVGYPSKGLAEIADVVLRMSVGSAPAGQYMRGGFGHDRDETERF
jgi:hypothetical protein